MNAPVVEVRSVSKRFGRVQANDNVDLTLSAGEVHALLGENGAGKSTLAKILYGYTRPDGGEILLGGARVELHSPRDARAHRIGMVFQNFMLIPALSVLENIALFLSDLPAIIHPRDVEKRIREFGERFGLVVDAHAPVRQLSVGDRQKVEILKLLLADARVLLFDEPTKVLAPHEAEALFCVFDALKADGYAILFITHKLREVIRCADRITVMRQGRVTATFEKRDADVDTLVEKMFGSASHGAVIAPPGPQIPRYARNDILELRNVSANATGSETTLRDLNLNVHAGEIVGVAGVSGSGQKELGDLILGMRPLARGTKLFCGEDASSWSIARLRENGVAFIPEDPLGMAAVAGMPVRENLSLGTGSRYHHHLDIDWRALESAMTASFTALEFPMPPLDRSVATLSGGNVQRAVIAREMAHSPKLIVALYPTRGLDVRSAASVRELLRRACDRGSGVLLISEDLDELAEVADRVLVMFAGSIAGEFARARWTADEVGHLMTGSTEVHLV
ncbi:MAG TPA: ABC transporter ATP-binding protein [Thermoanaerobaculia bacterium]